MSVKWNKIELSEEFVDVVERRTEPQGCQVPFVSRQK